MSASEDGRGGRGHTSARLIPGLVALVVACASLGACSLGSAEPGSVVLDDFESGSLDDWQAIDSGHGGWIVYGEEETADAAAGGSEVDVGLPDPPQGSFALATDGRGPGTRIVYRDLELDGRFTLRMTVYYSGSAGFEAPATLAHEGTEANQQFRVDLIDPEAPIDSLAKGDMLHNVFRTSPDDLPYQSPTVVTADLSRFAGETVRLRLAETDNRAPLPVVVDDIRFVPIDDPDDRIELVKTGKPTSALHLVVHRLDERDALAALTTRASERTRAGSFAGAVLVARDGDVLLEDAWGSADRESGVRNAPDTKFRIGSMNKMFTAVATLQLVEAGKLALDDTVGTHMPRYPNKEVRSRVTVRHLLTHTGGTGDIFGPDFDINRLKLKEHADYVELYGTRGPAYDPGARFEYSNYGFVLLGALIEAVTGESYYDYVRENVFRPAGMTSTDSLPESVDVPGRATGYMRPYAGADWAPNTAWLPWRGTAAGGGYSTVGDLLRFATALTSGTLLSKDTLEEATQPDDGDYGFGFIVQGEGVLRSFGHGGGAPGMNGELRIYPELGYVVAGLSNLDPPAASELVEYFTIRMPDG